MLKLETLDEIKSDNMIKEIEKEQYHKKCFNMAFLTNDMSTQKICLNKRNIFFPISKNRFLHAKCNTLLIEKLNKIKRKQIEILKKEMNLFFQKYKRLNLLTDSEKINTCINMFYQFHSCTNELKDSIICTICKKMINIKYVDKHVKICKFNNCSFIHVDGRKCKNMKHKNSLHNNFIDIYKLSNISLKNISLKFNDIFNIENLYKQNEIIVFKTKNIFKYTKQLVKKFSTNFDIVCKKCECFMKLKSCQCFRYCMINFNLDLSNKKIEKTLHKTILEFDYINDFKRRKIAIITVDKNDGLKEFNNFSFLSSFRKCNYVKLIFLHNFDLID